MSMSAGYHMMEFGGTARSVMARLDSGAIFILIAGTFTPFLGILFRGWGKWASLILIWTLAISALSSSGNAGSLSLPADPSVASRSA